MSRRRGIHEYHGLLVLDKPAGITSRAALNRVQQTLPRGARLGHTGTLDPLATGVLVVCLGRATRLAEYVQAMGKTYRSTFRLGATSDTNDADGTITPTTGAATVDRAAIQNALASFIGEIEQTPPVFSALRVAGRRAHDLARAGADLELAPRPIRIDRIDILAFQWPLLEVEVDCGKGTYIRSLARDLGAALGCGGLVETLRRTRVGPFRLENAIGPDATMEQIIEHLRPLPEAVSELPRLTVDDDGIASLRRGQAIRGHGTGETAVFDRRGGLAAICRPDQTGTWLRPVKVLPPTEPV